MAFSSRVSFCVWTLVRILECYCEFSRRKLVGGGGRMILYSHGVTTSGVTLGTAAWDILAPTGAIVRVYEMGVTITAPVATTTAIGFATNVPVQTSAIHLVQDDPNDPVSDATVAITWSTAPIMPVSFTPFRRVGLAGTIGQGYIVFFRQGIRLPAAGASLALWNITLGTTMDVWTSIEE